MSYETAGKLDAVYVYIYELLVNGNLKKDTAALTEAMELVRSLRDIWKNDIERHKIIKKKKIRRRRFT
jgi:flagellar protein FliS